MTPWSWLLAWPCQSRHSRLCRPCRARPARRAHRRSAAGRRRPNPRRHRHRAGRAAPLFGRRAPVSGAYLVGPVGRGKTMLMDLFLCRRRDREEAPRAFRRVHGRAPHRDRRRSAPRERGKDADPIAAVIKPIIADTRLLCLDEFQVNDITNAMLLGRLFEKLFAAGVTLVATSNTAPDELYRDGLNRQLFLPFIELLKSKVEIVALAGATDYRQAKFAGEAVFQFGTGPEDRRAMDRLWSKLTGGAPTRARNAALARPRHRRSRRGDGRGALRLRGALRGAARRARLSRLAHRYDTLMIDNVPRVRPHQSERRQALRAADRHALRSRHQARRELCRAARPTGCGNPQSSRSFSAPCRGFPRCSPRPI